MSCMRWVGRNGLSLLRSSPAACGSGKPYIPPPIRCSSTFGVASANRVRVRRQTNRPSVSASNSSGAVSENSTSFRSRLALAPRG